VVDEFHNSLRRTRRENISNALVFADPCRCRESRQMSKPLFPTRDYRGGARTPSPIEVSPADPHGVKSHPPLDAIESIRTESGPAAPRDLTRPPCPSETAATAGVCPSRSAVHPQDRIRAICRASLTETGRIRCGDGNAGPELYPGNLEDDKRSRLARSPQKVGRAQTALRNSLTWHKMTAASGARRSG